MEIFRCGGSARERCLVDVRDSGTDRRGDSIQISDILACERIGSFFAANPLGKHDLSGGEDTLNFTLAAGSPATFRHRIIIYTGESIAIEEIKQDWATFSKRK